MPRDSRLEALGLPLHVIVQGIERCPIFCDDFDRTTFVLRATRVFREENVQLLAWALMDNHVHLVPSPTRASISKAMQRLLCGYAMDFNRRHRRVGRLFRDRFWSRPVEEGEDLRELIGYVLLNPVRGGIVGCVEDLIDYPWTALSEFHTVPETRPPLVARTAALSLFAGEASAACAQLLDMLRARLVDDPNGDAHRHDEPGGPQALRRREREDLLAASTHALRMADERIDAEFRRRMNATTRRMLLERRGWTLDAVVTRAAAMLGADEALVRAGSRRREVSEARAVGCHFAGSCLRAPNSEMARAMGVSRQAVNGARRRGSRIAAERAIEWRAFFGVPYDPDGDPVS